MFTALRRARPEYKLKAFTIEMSPTPGPDCLGLISNSDKTGSGQEHGLSYRVMVDAGLTPLGSITTRSRVPFRLLAFRSSSGSLAILIAMRLASSRVSKLAVVRRSDKKKPRRRLPPGLVLTSCYRGCHPAARPDFQYPWLFSRPSAPKGLPNSNAVMPLPTVASRRCAAFPKFRKFGNVRRDPATLIPWVRPRLVRCIIEPSVRAAVSDSEWSTR